MVRAYMRNLAIATVVVLWLSVGLYVEFSMLDSFGTKSGYFPWALALGMWSACSLAAVSTWTWRDK